MGESDSRVSNSSFCSYKAPQVVDEVDVVELPDDENIDDLMDDFSTTQAMTTLGKRRYQFGLANSSSSHPLAPMIKSAVKTSTPPAKINPQGLFNSAKLN